MYENYEHLNFNSYTVLSFAYTKKSALPGLEATDHPPGSPMITTLSNGPGCTVHLTGPCPPVLHQKGTIYA